MGPNGSGKSTLANTILGHPAYEVTEGRILWRGEDITEADPEDRAQGGLFLAFQYPAAIPGVSVANFLRMAMNTQREEPINVKEFGKKLRHATEVLRVDREFTSRHLNDGFSGGEKKRCEILQMAMLEPAGRRARRDRLGPGHRRAAHGRRGREHAARGDRHGRARHHPLPAHPALREAAVRPHHARRARSSARAVPSWSTSSSARATTGCARRPKLPEAGARSTKPGAARQATLYQPLAGAGAGANGRSPEELRAAALEAYESLELPSWRRSGFWTTSLRDLDFDALEPRHHEPGEIPQVVTDALQGEELAGLLVQRGGQRGARRARPRAGGAGRDPHARWRTRSAITPSSWPSTSWRA